MGRTSSDLRTPVDTYLAEREARHECTPLSLRNFRCALYNFARAMDDRQVSGIGRTDIEEWLATRHRLSAATRRHNLSTVRTLLPVARPARAPASRPNGRDSPGARAPLPSSGPCESKVGKLLSAAPDARGVLIILLMVQEGLRCAEVSRLQVGDADFEGLTLRVVGKGATTGSCRSRTRPDWLCSRTSSSTQRLPVR